MPGKSDVEGMKAGLGWQQRWGPSVEKNLAGEEASEIESALGGKEGREEALCLRITRGSREEEVSLGNLVVAEGESRLFLVA